MVPLQKLGFVPAMSDNLTATINTNWNR